MNDVNLIQKLDKDIFSREDIFNTAKSFDADFKQTQMRNLLTNLMKEKQIVRVARNKYTTNLYKDKNIYIPTYSKDAEKLIDEVNKKFPYVSFQVWETIWLNEFMNHLLARNTVFIEIENDGCEFVYSELFNKYGKRMLLRPSTKELEYYNMESRIIVNRLISESPVSSVNKHHVMLEKIIVDLFANKTLQTIISQAEYADILNQMFDKYNIDQSKLFRYANRRNKSKEISKFIRENTDINIIVEV